MVYPLFILLVVLSGQDNIGYVIKYCFEVDIQRLYFNCSRLMGGSIQDV